MADADLALIAAGDHPKETERHYKALVRLREAMRVKGRLYWNPKEAVELQRWENPHTQDGHRRRLFACAILVDAYFEDDSRPHLHALSDTLAPLVESAICLGDDARIQALRTVSFFLETPFPGRDESQVFAGLATIMPSIAAARADNEVTISLLCDWVVAERSRLEEEELSAKEGSGLLGVTEFNHYHFRWQTLARDYFLKQAAPYAISTAAKLRALGEDILTWKKPDH